MSEVIVVPEQETTDAGEAAVAFAAGVAAAESAQASEDAAEALEVAEAAAETAEHAAEVAVEAVIAAEVNGVSREDFEALRAELRAELEDVRGMVADVALGDAEGPLTPERIEREEGPAPEDDGEHQEPAHESKRSGRYGNPRWFSR